MQWHLLKAVALGALLQAVSAVPAPASAPVHKVVKTTNHGNQVIDWVEIDSQVHGKVATPPPHPPNVKRANTPGIEQIAPDVPKGGPPGTVPVMRNKFPYPPKRLPTKADHNVTASGLHTRDGVAGTHYYASSNQGVDNHGGGAAINIWNAYVQSTADFNLLQVAVARDGVPGRGSQTIEGGFQRYPDLGLGDQPYLFTYYTTNGYSADGDNIGGYNQNQQGWVQVDSSYYPGIHLSPLSSFGGTQYEFTMQYYLFEARWWFFFIDRYIGYYEGALFSAGTDAASSLADHSTDILFYGEIYNSESTITTTDMGSGNFPESGFGQAAYIRKIQYIDTNNNLQDYNSHGSFVISDTNRYRLQDQWESKTDWGSFMYLGGPGAGGVVGG